MEKIVKKYLQNKNILKADNNVIIGFSGGFDSMALANIMISLSNRYHFNLILAHLNHNWRGKKALQEAKNCENFALKNNITFYTETLDKSLPHTETVAREERYAFFERAAKKYNSTIILTAHTKSDNIETIIQRIIKGTGISGLQGIQDTRELSYAKVFRPLLECSREDILAYCKEHKLTPNDDNSNADIKYLRNRIRNKLLPYLKENYDKNIENALYRLIQNAIDEEAIISELLKNKLSEIFDEDVILTPKFESLNLAIQKRIIKEHIIDSNELDYDQKKINDILNFIHSSSKLKAGKTLSLDKNSWLYVNNKIIEVIDKTRYNSIFAQVELNLEGETYLQELNTTIKVSKWIGEAPENFPESDSNFIYVDLSNIELPLTLRTRLYGDKIIPFGKKSPIKLKKYLNNKNLSKHDKSKVLLISSSKEVLWVINLGISNSIRVNGMPTHKIEILHKE